MSGHKFSSIFTKNKPMERYKHWYDCEYFDEVDVIKIDSSNSQSSSSQSSNLKTDLDSVSLATIPETECPICFADSFVDPKILPCGHTYCIDCIENWRAKCEQNQQLFQCPLCKSKSHNPILSRLFDFFKNR
jgi:hypothetical protein